MLYSEYVSPWILGPPGTYFQGEELSFWGEDLKGGDPQYLGGEPIFGVQGGPKNNTYAPGGSIVAHFLSSDKISGQSGTPAVAQSPGGSNVGTVIN